MSNTENNSGTGFDYAATVGYLRTVWERIDDMHTELCKVCDKLDSLRDWANDAEDLNDKARDYLLTATDQAIDVMCDLRNDCYDPAPNAIDFVLDALKALPMSE